MFEKIKEKLKHKQYWIPVLIFALFAFFIVLVSLLYRPNTIQSLMPDFYQEGSIASNSTIVPVEDGLVSNPGYIARVVGNASNLVRNPNRQTLNDFSVAIISTNRTNNPPVVKSFTATKYSINKGETTTLSWAVSNATSVYIDYGIGRVTKAGTTNVSPTETMTYTLTASNKDGIIRKYVRIDVLNTPPPAPTATFSANPVLIDYGSSSTLTWNTTDASSVTLDQGIGAVYPSSSLTVSPKTTTTYTLTVVNSAATITKQAIVTVTPPPAPTATFSANPTAVVQGASSTLSWSTTNATTATLDGTNVTTTGTKSVAPTVTTTYTLKVVGAGGEVTKTTTITVTPPQVVPTISSFSANPISITAGGSATLSWAITNATSASINQSIGTVSSTSGTKVVSPTATTTYTLTATNSAGSKTADVVVTVVTDNNVTQPKLILTQTDINNIKNRISAGQEPQKTAFLNLINGTVRNAMAASPSVVAGPQKAGGVGLPLEVSLDRDGQYARDLGLAYALTKDEGYAIKARTYLMAWAQGNTPTTYADSGDKWAGSYQAHGAFMFSYAYDLINSSSALSDSDKSTINAYFRRFIDALDTYNTKVRTEWVITTNPSYTQPYQWDANKRYYVYDNYVGSDMVVLQQAARLGMARMIGYQEVIESILNDPNNILGLQSSAKAALSPRNDGDGVNEGPAPQQHIYTIYTQGRGGMFDYMTYNTRVVHVLYSMAVNAGWDQAKTAEVRGRLQKSWTYMGRYFGPGAEPNFNPLDKINLTACVPRFALPYSEFGDQHFVDILNSQSNRASYYEPQLLGPVTLTHSIVKTNNVAVPTSVAKSVPEESFLGVIESFFADVFSSIQNFFEKIFSIIS